MLIDLLEIWKGPLIEKQRSLLPEKAESYSDGVKVATFDLPIDIPAGVRTVIIADKKTLTPVFDYQDLPKVELTKEEQEVVNRTAEEILKQKPPYNYDGDHFLLSGVLYDAKKNTVFVEAKQAKFSLLTCLNRKKFLKDSPIWKQDLYGAGVVASLVTNDGHTVLLASNKYSHKPYGSVAGFVQVKDDTDLTSLIERTAREELNEELFFNQKLQPRVKIAPEDFILSTVSFRKPSSPSKPSDPKEDGRGFVEFVIVVKLPCTLAALSDVIKTNVAPDHNEHTGEYVSFNLNPEERYDTYEQWSKTHPGGRDLYPTVVRAASRIFNKERFGDQTQRFMPGAARIESLPFISFIKMAIPQKPLSSPATGVYKNNIEASQNSNLATPVLKLLKDKALGSSDDSSLDENPYI